MKIRPTHLWFAAPIALLFATSASAAGFMEGVTAAGRGDYAEAQRIFAASAAEGDAKSQFALAQMYAQGQGVGRSLPTAIDWYRKAAAQSNPGAENALGLAYESGQGVRRDERTAAGWYAKAADHGYASAQVRLGIFYMEGRGVPQSDQAALEWFDKAGAQGDPEARQRFVDLVHKAVGAPNTRFAAMMDRVFGAGHWRETSGYRSVAKENQLRKEGAGTVPLGQRSHHSMGSPNAPGAYDIVVAGMSPQAAVAKLKRSRVEVSRVVAEAAHGTQGPHLHVEPALTRVSNGADQPLPDWARPAATAPRHAWTPVPAASVASPAVASGQ
jgi:hypothetical protein